MLILFCLLVLGAEFAWREIHLSLLSHELAAEQTKAATEHAAAVAEKDRAFQSELDRRQAEHKSLLQNTAWRSGALARERHEKEWALRNAHDPRLAKTILETNLLTMEQLGQDAAVTAQTALEKVARLASPEGSRVEVDPDGDGFRVRVAFMMSSLSHNESGAVTKHHTTAAMRSEIQELSARVMRDLYGYCGSRGIRSIAVTCNHTLRQSVIPAAATDEERDELLRHAPPIPARLYRVRLDQPRTQAIANWRNVALSEVSELCTVEYDGLTRLTISQSLFQDNADRRDAAGELQF